jgi:hypothetical protein
VAEPVVGWVGGEAVEVPVLDAYLVALGTSTVGTRVGVDELATRQRAEVGGAGGDGGGATSFSKESALRSWAAKSLLADRLLQQEAARLGVADPTSLDQWVGALEAAGEISIDPPGEADALACYRAGLHRYRAKAARRVRHLLVAERAVAEKLAGEVAKSGTAPAGAPVGVGPGASPGGAGAAAALGELASRWSLDEGSRGRGGDLGWVEPGQLAGGLEEVIFRATPGELEGPVESPFGWHLIVVEAVRPEGLRPFEDCREEIRADLARDRRREAFRRWWSCRLAEEVRVPAGAEHPLHPGLPGSVHRH